MEPINISPSSARYSCTISGASAAIINDSPFPLQESSRLAGTAAAQIIDSRAPTLKSSQIGGAADAPINVSIAPILKQKKTEIHKLKLAMNRQRYASNYTYREQSKKRAKKYTLKLRNILNNDHNKKQACLANNRDRQARSRFYKKFAHCFNTRYTSDADQIPATLAKKETLICFGKATKNYVIVHHRIRTLGSDIPYQRTATGGDYGTFQEVTSNSMFNVASTAWLLLGSNTRASNSNSFDNGSGLGCPSTYFSQAYFENGKHVGMEIDIQLAVQAQRNLQSLTRKAISNVENGCFDESYIKMYGELCNVCPPQVALLHGDIETMLHYGGFDFTYGFDCVHNAPTKVAMLNAWNHPLSKNCKLFITNSNLNEVLAYGYTDLVLVGRCKHQFVGVPETRTCFFYMRKSFHDLPKSKWTFDFENPTMEVSDPIKHVWQVLNQGRLAKGINKHTDINWDIMKMNLSDNTVPRLPDRSERGGRRKNFNYNEDHLADMAWSGQMMN